MTTIKDHCLLMARYGAWAYERMFASLATVSDADYRADCGLFFRSLHGTLNHLLGVMLNQRAGLHLIHIPYRGAAAAATDVGGQQ